jgi:ABC-type oligopeptide transport system substrate-binding subunit
MEVEVSEVGDARGIAALISRHSAADYPMNPPRCALLRRTRPSSPSRPLARQISAAAGCIALYLALTACGAPPPPPDRAATSAAHNAEEVIRLPLETPIVTLDPARAVDAVSRRITGQIFDTIVDWDPYADPPKLTPGLLEALPQPKGDGLTLTLTLRSGDSGPRFAPDPCLDAPEGARAGRSVIAADLADSLLRHAEPGLPGAYDLLAGRIIGLDAWRDLPPADRPLRPEGIHVVDAVTLTLRLTRPQPEFLAILGSPQLAIVPPECVRYYDGSDDAHPPWALHPVGSGPYELDRASSAPPRAASLRRVGAARQRPYPPPPGAPPPCPFAPALEHLVFEHFDSPETELRLFQRGLIAALAPGQANFTALIRAGEPRADALPPGTYLRRAPVLATTLLVFRMDDPVIGQSSDPAVDEEHRALRQAIAAAFDVARYLKIVRNDAWGDAATQLVPSALLPAGAPLHPFALPARDEALARALLAGADLGDRRIRLRYATTTGAAAQQEAAILRESLRPLGIDLDVITDDGYTAKILSGQLSAQLYALRYDADYPDPMSFLAPFTCASPASYTAYCSRRFDAAFARFANLPLGPDRDEAAEELERILGDDLPIRPIDTPSLWTLVRADLRGFVRHPVTGLRAELLCRP